MTDESKKKIYDAARKFIYAAVYGWDYEIDNDHFEEIVDEELIAVIDRIFSDETKNYKSKIEK